MVTVNTAWGQGYVNCGVRLVAKRAQNIIVNVSQKYNQLLQTNNSDCMTSIK